MSAVASETSPRSAMAAMAAASPDRREWPLSFSVAAYGVRVGVRADDVGWAEALSERLPPGARRGEFADVERVYSVLREGADRAGKMRASLYVDDAPRVRHVTVETVLRAFEGHLQLHVAEMAPAHVFVHAGVVGWQGRGIVLPGRSFSGKSTLVAELVRAGAEYYSDEYAVLDMAGGLHPYPRPLSIRASQGRAAAKYTAAALGGEVGTRALPVGLVVVSAFRKDGQWAPQRLSPGRGVLALMANTVPARRIPATVLNTLHCVVSEAAIIASERGEAGAVAEGILELATRS